MISGGMHEHRWWLGCLAAVWLCAPAWGDEESPAQPAAQLLARHCLECHNPATRQGKLDLTRRETALAGGEQGQAIDVAQPAESLLWRRISAGEMPPAGRPRLTDDERSLLVEWLAAGAPWAADPIDPFLYSSERRAGYNWWSLQPVRPVAPPEVGDNAWPVNEIDRFVLARLEAANMAPSPTADRRTLLRRLSYDLTGLPPEPEEMAAFLADEGPDAYERQVERLLDSPHYGEHWARHWLDIIRYGESQGFERNKLRPNAWRYRDVVVEAFNADLPYDEFIRRQIAGDVLHPDNPLAVVASGFLVMGPYDLTAYTNGTSDMQAAARDEELEGLVGTVCQTFLGLTVHCARCHDHKFDPITTREYYQFSAALGGTYHGDELESNLAIDPAGGQRRIAETQARLETLSAGPERSRLQAVLRLLQGGPAHRSHAQQPATWRILARGDFRQPGDVVSPRGIAAVAGVSPEWGLSPTSAEAERRIALARWIADPANPLTARTIVNRLWGYHFQNGLVTTPSDLGFQGSRPSHPELLDWLARELTHPAAGTPWSLKRIQRLIVLSATYRQDSRWREEPAATDRENRLVWRWTPQRLSAEAYRDSVLAISGQLNRDLGGPGYRDFTVSSAGNNETYTVSEVPLPEFNRRTLYRTWVRTGTQPLLDALDCPDPSVATPRRSVTTTPLQALSLLNGPFTEHFSHKLADRLRQEAANDVPRQVARGYTLAFLRKPTGEEAAAGAAFVAEHGLEQFCLLLFNANEFLHVD